MIFVIQNKFTIIKINVKGKMVVPIAIKSPIPTGLPEYPLGAQNHDEKYKRIDNPIAFKRIQYLSNISDSKIVRIIAPRHLRVCKRLSTSNIAKPWRRSALIG